MSLILSVNAGSSSLKISLYALSKQDQLGNLILTSSVSGISSPLAQFSFTLLSSTSSHAKDEPAPSIKDHASAFAHFLHALEHEANIGKDQIAHVCHRIVHGGDYCNPVVISDEEYHHIEKLSDLAPLHNGAALSVIVACINYLPKANSIAFFDTAFHRSIPPHIASYAIDQTAARQKGLKKYGFHGLSYAFILRSVAQYLQQPDTSLNLIVLHLGSGASACVIKQGRSLDTSMGLTPLDGLPGATRSGSVDPSLIFHYTSKAGKMSHESSLTRDLHITEAEDILNRKSGWKALTGTTDFRQITTRAFSSAASPTDVNPDRLAFDLFVDRVLNYVGSYYLKLDGQVDALVFSGGIGERSVELRRVVGEKLGCLGFAVVDGTRNEGVDDVDGAVVRIDGGGAEEKRVLVCRTDEQLEMARQCALESKFWED